ncbi:DUF1329 domain-containing protein [Pelagibacteraceae bacterium]|nr:DUF1329 domain-containing protein [Pelagibacteraceae bacterium]
MKYYIFFILLTISNIVVNAETLFTNNDIGDRIPISSPVENYNPDSNEYINPFIQDEIQFEINALNYENYLTHLTEGQIQMFQSYPETFFMNIYPSRRSCAVPREVLDLSKSGNANMIADGEGVDGIIGSIPFPNASEPLHHVWNHILRYRGVDIIGGAPYYVVNPDGTMTQGAGEAIAKNCWNPFVKDSHCEGLQGMLMQKVTHPPRLADASLLVIESLNALKSPRKAWVYDPGTRRVRRAPNIAYDYLGSASQGLSTADSFDGFNGAKDRYNWSNVGTELKFMPYNVYDFYNADRKNVLTNFHVNQKFMRYELVKVNIVRADVKSDKRHIYPHRVMYFDVDSHGMISEEVYDGKKEIMNYRELPLMNFYDEPACLAVHSATYNFTTRRYLLNNVRSSEIDKIIWRAEKPHDIQLFTPNGLKRYAK